MPYVASTCKVDATARIKDNAYVSGDCAILNNAVVKDKAIVRGDAIVADFAIVAGHAHVTGCSTISGNAVVNAGLHYDSFISDSAEILRSNDFAGMRISGDRYTLYRDRINGITIRRNHESYDAESFIAKFGMVDIVRELYEHLLKNMTPVVVKRKKDVEIVVMPGSFRGYDNRKTYKVFPKGAEHCELDTAVSDFHNQVWEAEHGLV
jgi:carbonic anhydrase/acetyltransferase-like protein (isoleucine patch superfamily)